MFTENSIFLLRKLPLLLSFIILLFSISTVNADPKTNLTDADIEVLYQKGLAHYKGNGVFKNIYAAADYFRQAAEQNHPSAQYNLAVLLENGEISKKNIPEAIYWYEKAAEQNHPKAQYNLAFLFSEGFGVDKDETKAIALFQMAADQGLAKAQYKLGCAYLEGLGVKADPVLALEWLNKAANQGDKDAIHTLELVREIVATR